VTRNSRFGAGGQVTQAPVFRVAAALEERHAWYTDPANRPQLG